MSKVLALSYLSGVAHNLHDIRDIFIEEQDINYARKVNDIIIQIDEILDNE